MQLNVYTNFFEELISDPNYAKYEKYKDDDFVIAWISSPSKSKNPLLTNELSIFIYFANIRGKILIKKEYGWESLKRIYLSQVPLKKPNEKGQNSISWSQYIHKKDHHIKLKFDTMAFNGFISLREITSLYGFNMWTLHEKEAEDILNEIIAVYEYENTIVLIPSIVSIQAFYTMSNENSLFDALSSPQGLARMVHNARYAIVKTTGERRFHVWASGNSHLADADLLTYFSQDNDLKLMFNNVSMNIFNSEKIRAAIPKKGSIEIVADYFMKKQNDGKIAYLITSVLRSNLVNDVAENLGVVEYYHPNKFTWKEDQNKSPTEGKSPYAKNTPGDNNLDDSNKVDDYEFPFLASSNDVYYGSTGSLHLSINEISAGTRKRSRKRKQEPKKDETNKSPSSRTPSGGKGDGKPIKDDNNVEKLQLLPEKETSDYNIKLIEELKTQNFEVTYKTYAIPFPNGSDKWPMFCYIDKDKTRRSFFVMRASGQYKSEYICFFYVDLEKDTNGNQKEILIIRRDDAFSDLLDSKIKPVIISQIEIGNSKWLKGNSNILQDNEFTTMHHMRNQTSVKSDSKNKNGGNNSNKIDIKPYFNRMIKKVLNLKTEPKEK